MDRNASEPASLDRTDIPARLGRFLILSRLGQGGMAVVYSAYDPKLDRRVALKLIRPSGTGRSAQSARNRLLREAQVLARLSHPNIVPIHDVGVIDDHVFLVMELVDGQSLRSWSRSQPRTWRETLAVYCQAGEGLVAAHRLGVIHRDFKPDNAIVGNDMRVRVIDLGLARAFRSDTEPLAEESISETGEHAASEPGHACKTEISPFASTCQRERLDELSTLPETPREDRDAPLEAPLTATQAILGTPAYMSPEQFRSPKVGPATDQFSFCVALYEALYGKRPFAGTSASELYENMLGERILPPDETRKVPDWIHTVLWRGLRANPAERYPSMQALLTELSLDAMRARRWAPVLGVLILLMIVSTAVVRRAFQAEESACQGASQVVARVWNAARRAEIEQVFLRTGSTYAQQSLAQVTVALDRYALDWSGGHTDACLAHQRGEQSGELLDRRMSCLERRLDAMNSTIAVLGEATAAALPNMVEMVQRLAPLDYCANPEALMAEVPPPDSPGVMREVEALRQRLHHTEALEYSGRYPEALLAATDIVTQAELLDYRPFLAEALLVHGRILIKLGRRAQAAETLQRTALTALAVGMQAVGVEAIARLIYVEGTQQPAEAQRALALRPYAESLLARTPEATFAHALLLNNTGIVYMSLGQRAQALEAFERALAVKERDPGTQYLELSYILQNLAMVTPDQNRRRELMQRALRELDHALGQFHPMALSVRLIYSRYLASPTHARDVLEPVCARYERYHPGLLDKRFECQSLLGFFQAEIGDAKRASQHWLNAAELIAARTETWEQGSYQLMRGYAHHVQGEHEAALTALQAAREIFGRMPEQWWWQLRVAEAELGLGLVRLASGQEHQAIGSLEAALRMFEDVALLHQDSVLDRELARTRLSLARALTARRHARPAAARTCNPRALELLGQAEAWYRSTGQGTGQDAGPGAARRLDEIEQLRRERLSACR